MVESRCGANMRKTLVRDAPARAPILQPVLILVQDAAEEVRQRSARLRPPPRAGLRLIGAATGRGSVCLIHPPFATTGLAGYFHVQAILRCRADRPMSRNHSRPSPILFCRIVVIGLTLALPACTDFKKDFLCRPDGHCVNAVAGHTPTQ